MKTALLFLLLAALCLRADDLTTRDGKVYKGYQILSHDGAYATILFSDGGAKIELSNLPTDVQTKLGYDPAKAQSQIARDSATKLALEQQATATARIKSLAATTSRRLVGKVMRVTSDGFVISNTEVAAVVASPAHKELHYSPGTRDGFGSGRPATEVTVPATIARPKGVPSGPYFVYASSKVEIGDDVDIDAYPAKDYIDGNEKTGADIYTAFTTDIKTSTVVSN